MSCVNMNEMLKDAQKHGYAVGAFNIVNYLTTEAVIKASEELRSPVILQTSTSTVKQIGLKPLIDMLIPMAEAASVPVAIHLDHCTDVEMVYKCIDAGWSSVMIDASKESFEKNIQITADVVKYAAAKNVSVEGELGAIVGVEDDIKVDDKDAMLADPVKSVQYVKETDIHAFAPAIGTAHGLYKGEPKVDFDRFKLIADTCNCPMVVHGGTGLSPEVFKKLIALGGAKINISTAIKIAYCGGMTEYTSTHSSENNPLKLDKFVLQKVKECTVEHIEIFGSKGRG